jgi:uncharacterized UPF0160 family protein
VSYLPTWRNDKPADDIFLEAVAFAKGLILREIEHSRADVLGDEFVEKAYQEAADKRIIVLDKEYEWKEVIAKYSEPLIVVFPQNGDYHAKAVRKSLDTFETRIKFPESWAGKRDKELANLTGVDDAVFCHNNLFIVVARSEEGAIALARKALEFTL